jgi:hypothetical protein
MDAYYRVMRARPPTFVKQCVLQVPVVRPQVRVHPRVIANNADSSKALLVIASRRAYTFELEEVLAKHANVNYRDVMQGGVTPLIAAVRAASSTTVQWLLRHGADVNLADDAGVSPLFHAAAAGNVALIADLAEAGAMIDAATKSGWTALYYALDLSRIYTSTLSVVCALIDVGASVRRVGPMGTALTMALRTGNADIITLIRARVHAAVFRQMRDWMIAMVSLRLPACVNRLLGCMYVSDRVV